MPTLFKSERDDRAVEDSHDRAFTEHGRQHADPQVDRVTTDHQLDSPVLRQATFGDIQIGHDLDPRGNGKSQVTRRRHHLVQHPLRLDADAKLVFERFEVNIAGVILDRQQQHHVQQFAHRGTIGQRLGVGQVEGAIGQCAAA